MSALILVAPLLPPVGAVLVLAAITVRRNHRFVVTTTALCLAATTLAAALAADLPPRYLGPLFIIDRFTLFFAALLGLASLTIALLAHRWLTAARTQAPEELYLLLLTATTGGIALAATDHLAGIFLGLETLSISLFGLVAYPRQARSSEAALKLLVLSGAATALLLFGLGLLYAATGSVVWRDVLAALRGNPTGPAIFAGAALLLAGLAFELALVPLHMWAPDVFAGAPLPVTALIATVAKAAVLALLVRLVLTGGPLLDPALLGAVALLAAASMLAGNILALFTGSVTRLLAYSSTSHMGYVMVALLAGGSGGARAALFYVVAYVVTSLLAFGSLVALSPADGELDRIEDLRGLMWRRPALAALLATALLSLAGMPLTAGFIGKVYLIASAVGAADWLLLGALVLGSAIGVYFYLRVVLQLLAGQPAPRLTAKAPGAALVAAALGVMLLLLLGLGIYPNGLDQLIAATVGSAS